MMVRKTYLSAVVFLFLCAVSAAGYAFDDGDFQYWNTNAVSKKIHDQWKLTGEEEFRWGDNARNPYYNHTDIGIVYSGLARWFDIGFNYRYIREEKNGRWRYENRPHIDATVKWKFFDVSLSNRGRFEYRDREKAENFWRYTNKFTVKAPGKFTLLEIQPYVADEIFYDFDGETLNRNRLYGGMSFLVFKNVNGEVYYLWESTEKSEKWNDIHVLGTKLKIAF